MSTERVLVLFPPHAPAYFNAGHHLALFQVARWLRHTQRFEVVDTFDAGALNATWKDVADVIYRGYDHVVVMNDFDGYESFARAVSYVRALSPGARIATFGRLGNLVPGLFTKYDVDAVVETGDPEIGVELALTRQPGTGTLPGVHVREAGEWLSPSGAGRFLDAADLAVALPDIAEIPYAAYDRLYADDQRKFCGIPNRRELVVPVSRGCPVGCHFCDVPTKEGLRDRRLEVETALDYIRRSFEAAPFEYVSMYSPTFTLSRKWTVRWCEALLAEPRRYPWKCTTTPFHLDSELIALMGKSGCVRISIGLETLAEEAHRHLPVIKHTKSETLESLGAACTAAGIELNCFVILGLPGASVHDTKRTVDLVRKIGGRVRPTVYTPYEQIHAAMSNEDVAAFNRHLLPPAIPAADTNALYGMFFGKEPRLTRVQEAVTRTSGAPRESAGEPSHAA